MPGSKKDRCCRFFDSEKIYKPGTLPFKDLSLNELLIDEFEAVRLCDHDKLNQVEASGKMKLSRITIQRLLEACRLKIIDAFLMIRL